MSESTPKPTDALEELVRVIDEIAANFERQSNWIPDLMACLAAWEKERARLKELEQALAAVADLLSKGAARVEQLGRWAQAEKERVADNMQEVAEQEMERRGRVEEKKAAFLEAACTLAKWMDQTGQMAGAYDFVTAYRALVEYESASKKEDAGT